MPQQGQYSLQDALNRCLPVAQRAKLGDMLAGLITAVNTMLAQTDVGNAIDGGIAALASGTLTVGGSVTNGNSFKVTFVNASMPPLVTPGLQLGPVNIVTADTTTTVATKLTALLNADPTLLALGFTFSSSAAVVTVKGPGTAANSTVMTAQLSAGATISVTASNPTGGTGAVPVRNSSLAVSTLASLS